MAFQVCPFYSFEADQCNKEECSANIDITHFALAGPPGQPQVVKVGRGYADLIWEASKTDGKIQTALLQSTNHAKTEKISEFEP